MIPLTIRQKFLVYAAGLLAAYLFTWPVALLALFFFADRAGDVPTKYPTDGEAGQP